MTQRLTTPEKPERWLFSKLPERSEQPPRAAPRSVTLDAADVAERLASLTGDGAERRDGQRAYAGAAAAAFSPRVVRDSPNLVLAEAGTGIGKTARLSRSRLALGGAGRRRGVGIDLHQGAPAPARP